MVSIRRKGGWANVSDVFVSALWVLDWLPQISKAGAVRQNFHGGPVRYSLRSLCAQCALAQARDLCLLQCAYELNQCLSFGGGCRVGGIHQLRFIVEETATGALRSGPCITDSMYSPSWLRTIRAGCRSRLGHPVLALSIIRTTQDMQSYEASMEWQNRL